MPWTVRDVDRHIRDLTDAQKRVWVSVANSRLAACLKGGGKRETCEASAIRQANSVAKGVKESMPMEVREAATVKARLQALMRAADGLLADKDLSKAVRSDIVEIRAKLKRRWDEVKDAPEKEGVSTSTKAAEAARFLTEAKAIIDTTDSYQAREQLVQAALSTKFPPPADRPYDRPWIRELLDDAVVFRSAGDDGKLFQASYVIDRTGSEPKVTLGEVTQVQVVYATVEVDGGPAIETAEAETPIAMEFIPLVEKAVRKDGTVSVKVIEPGWGSSGYYPEETLKRDGPKVFAKGTQMYWDHPTVSEAAERPERSLRDLAGRLTSNAEYKPDGPAGPGLYAEAKIYGAYHEAINELAADIGTSIRAVGKGKRGEIEGRTGPIIERIVAAQSVDFVTRPGAGGQVMQLFEAARGRNDPLSLESVDIQQLKRSRPDLVEALRTEISAAVHGDKQHAKEARKVEEAEAKQLTETSAALTAENARLKEQILLAEAERFVVAALKSATLPEPTKARLAETLRKTPVLKEGKLDAEAYQAAITEAVRAETEYLAKIVGSGQVSGMGAGGEASTVKLNEAWERYYIASGKSPDEAKRLAALTAGQRR